MKKSSKSKGQNHSFIMKTLLQGAFVSPNKKSIVSGSFFFSKNTGQKIRRILVGEQGTIFYSDLSGISTGKIQRASVAKKLNHVCPVGIARLSCGNFHEPIQKNKCPKAKFRFEVLPAGDPGKLSYFCIIHNDSK